MAHVVNDGLVAFVRLTEGGTVKLHEGDTVPAKADANHVASLTKAGVLSVTKESKGSRSGGSSGSSDQS